MAAFLIALGFINTLANSPWAFVFVYSLTMFFANAGPNTTTFVIPAELFPTRFRSTLFGICAASGKLGAIIATFGISYIRSHVSLAVACTVLAIPVLIAASFTHMIPETCGRSLEEIQNGGPEEEEDEHDGGEEGGGAGPGDSGAREYHTNGYHGYHSGPPPGYDDEDRGPEPDSCGMPLTGDALEPVYGGSTHGSSNGNFFGPGSPTFGVRSAHGKPSWTSDDDRMMCAVPLERDSSNHPGVPGIPAVLTVPTGSPNFRGRDLSASVGPATHAGRSELQEIRCDASAPEIGSPERGSSLHSPRQQPSEADARTGKSREGKPFLKAPMQRPLEGDALMGKPRERQDVGRSSGKDRELREVTRDAGEADESSRVRVAVLA